MPIINPTLPADGDDAIVSPYNTAITAILGVLNGSIDADNLAAGAVTLAKLATVVQGALVPTGLVAPFGGSTAPTGWLLCDGSSQLRASYSALFAVLGTNYGSVDGTHFNLPDLRGRVPVGSDTMGTSAANRMQLSTTITTTSGSPTATVPDSTSLSVGMVVVSANVPAGTTISAVNLDHTTLTLSANATASGSTVAARFSILGNDAQVLGAVGGNKIANIDHNHGKGTSLTTSAGSAGAYVISTDNTVQFMSLTTNPVTNIVQPSQVVSYIIKT